MGNVRPPANRDAQDPLLKYGTRRKSKVNCFCKCCLATVIVIVVLLLLLFLAIFVGLPLVFKYSPELQHSLVYATSDLWPPNPEFTNFKKYGIEGVRNLYVTVNEAENVTLGVWHVLPEALINDSLHDENFNYSVALAQPDCPVILHFHGNAGNRIADVAMYEVLRLFFHVIAFDYRGYADSSPIKPSELGIVEDSIQLYKWLLLQTKGKIYFWGHSLGSALSTHTIARLHDEGIIPMGLFLEAPFTTLKEATREFWLSKFFSWLPWYETTMLDPLDENGLYLKTAENILKVDCPIMIVHAEDDINIPCMLGKKLATIAQEERDYSNQGNVTFHLLPAYLHCAHVDIYTAPDLPAYIRDHIEVCEEYYKKRG